MESIGERMRQSREEMGVSIEQAARDTLISKRYLVAIEREDFSTLPGDTYVHGFIRNYAAYLSLDAEEMVNLYRNLLLQEQPIPMNELLEVRRGPSALGIVLIVLAIAVLGAGGFFGVRALQGRQSAGPQPAPQPEPVASAPEPRLVLTQEVLVQWFDVGEVIGIPAAGEVVPLTLVSYDGDLTVAYPDGEVRLRIGAERLLDLDDDAGPDLRLLLNDADAGSAGTRVNLGLYRLIRPRVAAGANDGAAGGAAAAADGSTDRAAGAVAAGSAGAAATGTAATGAAAAGAAAAAGDGAPAGDGALSGRAPVRARQVAPVVVRRGPAPAPFSVSLSFRGHCLLRYAVDDDTVGERFFRNGESIVLDPSREVTLWLSNAGAATARIDGTEVSLGNNGAVATKLVRWEAGAADGQQQLVARTLF